MGSCPMKRRNILASNHNECCKMVLTSESVDENVCCDHSNETLWQYLHKVLFVFQHLKKGNRPFPSSKKFHFQNEAKCETFVLETSFICIIIKTHFHNKGFALSLVLKVKLFGTRKWPI